MYAHYVYNIGCLQGNIFDSVATPALAMLGTYASAHKLAKAAEHNMNVAYWAIQAEKAISMTVGSLANTLHKSLVSQTVDDPIHAADCKKRVSAYGLRWVWASMA